MNNETEGLTPANPAVGNLYRAANNLSTHERTAPNNELIQDSDQQETTVFSENISAQARILQQINLMPLDQLALVLDAIAARLRSEGAATKEDDL
jgi:hypothetical protein